MITKIFTCTKPRMKHKNKGFDSLNVELYLNSLTDNTERVYLRGAFNSNPAFKSEFATRFQQFDNLLDILFNPDSDFRGQNLDLALNDICTVQRSDNTDINNMYKYLLEDILEELQDNAPVDVSYAIIKELDRSIQQLDIYPDLEETLANYL